MEQVIKNNQDFHFRKSISGFTLAEVMVTITIFVILTILIVTFYMIGLRIFREKNAEQDLVFSSQNTLKEIIDNTKRASSIEESVIIGGILYSSGTESIVLKLPSTDDSGQTIYINGEVLYFDYFIYEFDPVEEKIIKNIFPDTESSRTIQENHTLMSGVTSLNFSYYPNDPPINWSSIESIEINLSAYKTISGKTKTINLMNRVKPRNQQQ